MATISKEKRLIKTFLTEYKKMVKERTNLPFHPRSLTIISQPNLKDETEFDWISYNSFFDELGIGVYQGSSNNIIETFLEVPIHILISAEELKKPLISKTDEKKLAKALKLIGEIKLKGLK